MSITNPSFGGDVDIDQATLAVHDVLSKLDESIANLSIGFNEREELRHIAADVVLAAMSQFLMTSSSSWPMKNQAMQLYLARTQHTLDLYQKDKTFPKHSRGLLTDPSLILNELRRGEAKLQKIQSALMAAASAAPISSPKGKTP